ncbi:Receptor-type guanylate cyclase gcy [Seminavis robusta]|uniref:Receptor-type guanylate cyclase gcy n=1 Tax=Seminavis robusta TaxID=568900 RepID=A0A9N8D7P6_9STRA|nr:Receptor-type guanylate cyclase gcy [Seminavis robusta]|eukprot:Sro27_g018150.1 Receptor-type guanylate cyclase gcy (1269) ;mRNA; r:69892-75150
MKNNWQFKSASAASSMMDASMDDDLDQVDPTFTATENKIGAMDSSWGHMSGSGQHEAAEEKERQKVDAEVKGLVKKETRMVHTLRVIVIVVLLVAAFVTSSIVYSTFKDKEYDSFLEEYRAISTRIIDLFRNDILQKLWAAKNLASTVSGMIQAQQDVAPNITIPAFDAIVLSAIKLAPAGTVKWSPLLYDQQDRDSFLAYASAGHHDHIVAAAGTNQSLDSLDQQDSDDESEDVNNNDDAARRLARLLTPDDHYSNFSSPVWQASPSFGKGHNALFYDLMANPIFSDAIQAMIDTKGPVMSRVYELGPIQDDDSEDGSESEDESKSEDEASSSEEDHESEDEVEQHESEDDHDGRRRLDSSSDSDSSDDAGDGKERAMTLFFPVFEDDTHTHIVGSVSLELLWSDFLSGYLLVEGGEELNYAEDVFDTDEVDAILENTCGQVFTTSIDESSIKFVQEGDAHDPNFDHLNWGTNFEEFAFDFRSFREGSEDHDAFDLDEVALSEHGQQCFYSLILYPNQELIEEHLTNEALLFCFAVIFIFMFTSSLFIIYDCLVSRRQSIITKRAMRTNAIVASLFPAGVRDKLIGADIKVPQQKSGLRLPQSGSANKAKKASPLDSDPIADLFPECTCIFADIAGFTAWSSEREPPQVFRLLERTFADFDQAAKRLGVFKVETIGDCYVAVVGLPTPREDHAVVGAVFARSIVRQMKILLKDLEKTLGPSTADLDIRVGVHSGPVTAGVLRGEKSRFQLFGDTMNVCSRMESSGKAGMIHVSGTCADKLKEAGFAEWLNLREDTPEIKGKGIMKTYWLRTREEGTSAGTSSIAGDEVLSDLGGSANGLTFPGPSSHHRSARSKKEYSAKINRLVEWNVQLLSSILLSVVARRASERNRDNSAGPVDAKLAEHGGPMLDEVKEILALAQFDAKAHRNQVNPASITLPPEVVLQLSAFVEKVAATYHDNSFHCFEHAAHVTMSVQKLLSRIVRPNDLLSETGKQAKTAVQLHDHTFGITSDPLTQFAVVLSALIHDAGHPGVTNSVLVEEKDPMALKYKDKSVAEQNSVDLALGLLDLPEFVDLRNCIYTNKDEFNRFRSTIINLVLATDIMDRELGALRKERWSKAFNKDAVSLLDESDDSGEDNHTVVNRKATIVLEHIIQASDVAHTMQHWHVFQKWNEKLFHEMYQAYLDGRLEKDPSDNWYEGEIGFFDFYIIPLAKKLETCGVFGVSSHEYLSYAEANRHEWVIKGPEIVKGYLAKFDGASSGPNIGTSVEC